MSRTPEIESTRWAARLNELIDQAGLLRLEPATTAKFANYLSLFLRWNARTNLSAIRDEEGILSRHFLESIACAQALPTGLQTLLDFGSGGGFPGVPIALVRPEIEVVLAESQGKKAAFLQEVVRSLGLTASVHAGRAETLERRFDCVTMRAVDHMAEAVQLAAGLVAPQGWLALMGTESEGPAYEAIAIADWEWQSRVKLPCSEQQVLLLGKRSG